MAVEQTFSCLLCILCISAYFLPIFGALEFHRSSNTLEYRNASMGHQVTGVVSQYREQVWLYSWINKTEVNLVDNALINFTVRPPHSLILLWNKAAVPQEIYRFCFVFCPRTIKCEAMRKTYPTLTRKIQYVILPTDCPTFPFKLNSRIWFFMWKTLGWCLKKCGLFLVCFRYWFSVNSDKSEQLKWLWNYCVVMFWSKSF